MSDKSTELVEIIKVQALPITEAEVIAKYFNDFFQEAKEWESKAKSITVTEETQVELMEQAKEARLALKRIRVDADNKRKELKEKSLREGRAIDGIANIIKALVVPLEEHLEKQEKFLEIRTEERLQKKVADRIEALSKYHDNPTFYNLREMSDEGFQSLFDNARIAWENKKIAEQELEEKRIAEEKKRREEEDRIRAENDKLRKEKAEAEKKAAEDRKKAEEERRKLLEKQQAEEEARKKVEDELKRRQQEEIRAKQELERKLAEEQAAKEKLEKEKRFNEFLAKHKYSTDTKHLFHVERTSTQVKLYKLVGTYNIE